MIEMLRLRISRHGTSGIEREKRTAMDHNNWHRELSASKTINTIPESGAEEYVVRVSKVKTTRAEVTDDSVSARVRSSIQCPTTLNTTKLSFETIHSRLSSIIDSFLIIFSMRLPKI